MALHRDIFWIGRQWVVTGHGMQLIDQRLMGAFDIEVARLWDDNMIERVRAKEWLNATDFDKGLAVARTRYPQAVSPPPPPKPERPATVEPPQPPPAPPEAVSPQPLPIEQPPKQESSDLQMKIDGGAKFARPWRVWMKKP